MAIFEGLFQFVRKWGRMAGKGVVKEFQKIQFANKIEPNGQSSPHWPVCCNKVDKSLEVVFLLLCLCHQIGPQSKLEGSLTSLYKVIG